MSDMIQDVVRVRDGLRLHYRRQGRGRALVLLHGFPQTSHQWRKVVPALAERFTVVAPDLRGYGDSDRPAGGYDKRTMAADVADLIQALGLAPVGLVGHDRGGRVAHRFALDHPALLTHLVLLDIAPTYDIFQAMDYPSARQRWHWSLLRAGALAGAFLTIDLAFFGANIIKIAEGGWVPLAIGGGAFLLMNSWHRGTELLRGFLAQAAVPMDRFLEEVERAKPPRVHGTAIFLTPDVDGAPLVLQRHLRYNKVLHEEVILLSILTEEIPEVEHDKRVTTEALPQGFHRVRAYYGFMERPDVQEIVAICRDFGLKAEPEETTYYLGRAELLSTGPAPMMRWRKWLFSLMSRNASAATDFFNIPPNRVVELGARIEF